MIKDNIEKINSTLPERTRLIAVSKTKPVEMLQEAYDAGQRLFGENKALEMRDKYELLPKDIEWHFIGHLQTNKVKYIAPFISLIHSADSVKLLKEIDKQGQKCGRVVDVLLQIHVAQEETKFGFTPDELLDWLATEEWKAMGHIRIVGLMAMGTNTNDETQIAREFETVRQLFHTVKESHFADQPPFRELSMGMSGDYLIAQERGSTMVRVGSLIFGERIYQ